VRALAGFIIRLVGYVLVFAATATIAGNLWVQYGLDGSVALQPFHDGGVEALYIAPLPLALLGFGRLRQASFFIAAMLIGAALTAPFAAARFAGV
jgi:hypothetical protein